MPFLVGYFERFFYLKTMIGIYKNRYEKKPIRKTSIENYIDCVLNGEWEDYVLSLRNEKDDEKRKKLKDLAPCLTLSGYFPESKENEKMQEHSGYIAIDIDAKDQIGEVNRDALEKDPYTFVLHDSISGNGGLVIVVKIEGEKHLEAFEGLREYYLNNYRVYIDKSCKNVSRIRYVSYDPSLFQNDKAKVFKKYIPKKEQKIHKQFEQKDLLVIESDLDEAIQKARHLNLFDSYEDYLRVGFALADEFGANGRDKFHALCSSSSKYDYKKADEDYNKFVSRKGSGITIGYLYFKLKEAGIKVKSENTEKMESIIKLADNPKEELKKLGLTADDSLIDKLTEKKDKTELDLVVEAIKLENIKFNEVERNYEFKGKLMNDRILSEFYVKIWERINEDISKDKVFTLIQSPKNHVSYHPIKQWFEKNKAIEYSNEFEKLKECFVIWHNLGGQRIKSEEYLDIYLKKWLHSIVASAHGTYSLLILVLTGAQGNNKTRFFRGLLPNDLQNYYAESTLDEGKDSEILMCKKLLIVDDEFGGKTKKDAQKLKRLSSQQKFSIRMPYGRVSEDLQRLAVLGGTSNDLEVINDPTGNRRIIPLNLISFDVEKFNEIDKDKLFIEIYHEWKQNKEWWFLSKAEIDILNATTEENTEVMTEEEIINKIFEPYRYPNLTNTDVMFEMQSKFIGLKTSSKRVGQALKKLGYIRQVVKDDATGKTQGLYAIKLKQSVTV
jgi:hypothetical protein